MIRTTVIAASLAVTIAVVAPPSAPKKPVTDSYHGVAVTDEYRWLEDWNDKDVQKWSEAQNAHARSVLDKLPGVEALREKLTKIIAAKTTSHFSLAIRAGKVFALRRQPPKEQPFLVVLPAAEKPGDAKGDERPEQLSRKATGSKGVLDAS